MLIGSACGRTGSSPLARGAHTESAGGRLCLRLIPTHAGNIGTPQLRNGGRSAHPRSRGEHSVNDKTVIDWKGSSPLTRGTRFADVADDGQFGLIPVRAGNISSPSQPSRLAAAHPCSRGEHDSASHGIICTCGSSPFARGPRASAICMLLTARLIPARAGTTLPVMLNDSPVSAHPRSRGDHAVLLLFLGVLFGSSPLARGPRSTPHARGKLLRLIPARAGTTSSLPLRVFTTQAHPRSRGDHSIRDESA